MLTQELKPMDHSAHDAIALLKRKFGGRVISVSGPVNVHASRLFSLLLRQIKATMLAELKANIERTIAIVTAKR